MKVALQILDMHSDPAPTHVTKDLRDNTLHGQKQSVRLVQMAGPRDQQAFQHNHV